MTKFRNTLAENVFSFKYNQGRFAEWRGLCAALVDDVCGTFQGKGEPLISKADREQLVEYMADFKFIPGGRYLYYAGRPLHFWNNCFLLRAEEDTREEWAELNNRVTSCLMSGGGIGVDYSILREEDAPLKRTGGKASGPMSLMKMINEIGRYVMQGGSRRSAIYGSLNWQHPDIKKFLTSKDWHNMPVGNTGLTIADIKAQDFNFPAPLDMTNISPNYDDAFLAYNGLPDIFVENVRQAMRTGEPGFSFNFGTKQNESLRNACCEITSSDDSDVCNLGSVNMAMIESKEEFEHICYLASQFLLCGTTRATLPYAKVYDVRAKNRRLGLGLMGMHEWLLKRGYRYEVVPEMHNWLGTYAVASERGANYLADKLGISRPIAYRAIAPTGTIGILACTTTGIEPLFAVAYKRRFLKNGKEWHYQYVVDSTAQYVVNTLGINPEKIESAVTIAADFERRIKFQADVQDYVDMSISSTINLPAWNTEHNNEDRVIEMATLLKHYAPRLRGFTVYPDGARGGQPITPVDYKEAVIYGDVVYREHDVCDISKGGFCGS